MCKPLVSAEREAERRGQLAFGLGGARG